MGTADTTYYLTVKDDARDHIHVEIGDSKQSAFYPQVKMMRWDNEVNFSVRLEDSYSGLSSVSSANGKVTWAKEKIKAEFYQTDTVRDGATEFAITFFEKPVSNVLRFRLQSKGLEFHYQPPLYNSELAKRVCDRTTETEGFKDGKLIMFRPEHIVGSYAVYYRKHPLNIEDGKLYRTGKAFHIYRPKIIDAEGKSVWGDLFIDAHVGVMTVTIPQEFLDSASYPISHAAGATFGNTTLQATVYSAGLNSGGYFQAPATGVISSITCGYSLQEGIVGDAVAFGFYTGTATSMTGACLGHSDSTVCNITATPDWQTCALTGPIITNTPYWLCQDQNVSIAYLFVLIDENTDENLADWVELGAFNTWPAAPAATFNAGYIISAYATYSAGSPTLIGPFPTHLQVAES